MPPSSVIETVGKLNPPLHSTQTVDAGTNQTGTAITPVIFPNPTDPSVQRNMEPVRNARKFGERVCVLDAIAPPQCEFDMASLKLSPEMAGKQVRFLERVPKPPHGDELAIATASAVSSRPTNPSVEGREPWREARNFGEGVCAVDTLMPPQCECDSPSTTHTPKNGCQA
jgi:hypothetical protein